MEHGSLPPQLLVIACPCALVISTPVTVVSGLAAAAKAGILIKGGAYLEQGRDLKVLALDNTGTLTRGTPEVTDLIDLSGNVSQALQIAASLAARSDHPVSTAVHRYWKVQADAPALSDVTNFQALAGRGTKGTIDNNDYYLGNHRLVEQLVSATSEPQPIWQRWKRSASRWWWYAVQRRRWPLSALPTRCARPAGRRLSS